MTFTVEIEAEMYVHGIGQAPRLATLADRQADLATLTPEERRELGWAPSRIGFDGLSDSDVIYSQHKELDTARARIAELESRLRNCDEYTDVAALRDRIAELERELCKRNDAKGKLTVREACRQRAGLDGADAQALEHALTMTEAERDAARKARDEMNHAAGQLRDERDAARADALEAEREEARLSFKVAGLERERDEWQAAAEKAVTVRDAAIAEVTRLKARSRQRAGIVRELREWGERMREGALREQREVLDLREAGNDLIDAISTPRGRDFEQAWEAACLHFGRYGAKPTLLDAARAEVADGRELAARLTAEVERLQESNAAWKRANDSLQRHAYAWQKRGWELGKEVDAMRPVCEAVEVWMASGRQPGPYDWIISNAWHTYRASRAGDKFVGPYCAHCGGQHLGIDCPTKYPPPPDGAPDRVWIGHNSESGQWVTWRMYVVDCEPGEPPDDGVEYIRHDIYMREATRHHELLEDYRKAAEEANGRAKLNAAKVLDIRARAANGENLAAMAREYGVTDGMVGHILHGRSWTHIS